MKRVLVGLFLIIYGFSFFTIFNYTNATDSAKFFNIENNLNNSYRLLLPSKISKNQKEDTYNKIKLVLHKYKASVFFMRENDGVTIKYIYINNMNYFKNYTLSNGVFLTLDDMESQKFLSSTKSGDKKQIGRIEEFGGNEKFQIRTLKDMILSNNMTISGDFIVQLPNNDIENFRKDLKQILQLNTNITILQKDSISTKNLNNVSILINPILYLLVMLLVLYDILKSNKSMGIQVLYGYSIKDIWMEKMKEIFIIQLASIGSATLVLSLFMFKNFNMLTLSFLGELLIDYIKQLLILLSISSLPFIFIITMNVSNMIKNKRATRNIILFNTVIKSILLVLTISLSVSVINNYSMLENVYNNNYKYWEKIGDYVSITDTTMPTEISTQDECLRKNKELYCELNKNGSILADFCYYTLSYQAANPVKSDREFENYAVANPNYLKFCSIYDIDGNIVNISEQEKARILLVPEKYKHQEHEIRDYFKFISSAYDKKWIIPNQEIKIIWINNEQKLLSYNIEVNPNEFNMVKNPIVYVLTENNAPLPEYDKVIGYSGNPLKIPKNDSYSLTDLINEKLKDIGSGNYKYTITASNEQMATKIKEIKDIINYSIIGICIIFMVMIIVIIHNMYNYCEQYKKNIVIRSFHGYKYFDKYKEYYNLLVLSQIITLITSLIIIKGNIKGIILIFIGSGLIEYILSYYMLKTVEKRNMSNEIKGS